MKNYLFYFCALMIVVGMQSCSNNELINESSSLQQTKSINPDNRPYWVTEDGALRFLSVDSYFSLCDSLNKLSDNEFVNWENQIAFFSYRTASSEAIAKIEEAEGTSLYGELLKKYSNLFYVIGDSVISPKIEAQSYRNIVNLEGVFYIGEIKNVIEGNNISGYNAINGQCVLSKQSYLGEVTQTKASSGYTVQYPEYVHDYGKKRVLTQMKLYNNMVAIPGFSSPVTRIELEILVRGSSLNFWGKWKKYETVCSIDDISFTLSDMPEIFNTHFHFSDVNSTQDVVSFTSIYTLSGILSGGPYLLKDLICVHYRARTRGTGENGVAYNFHKGNFITSKDDPSCNEHAWVSNHRNVQ